MNPQPFTLHKFTPKPPAPKVPQTDPTLWALDDYSERVQGLEAADPEKAAAVLRIFNKVLRLYGV